jgi:hypothetical protein
LHLPPIDPDRQIHRVSIAWLSVAGRTSSRSCRDEGVRPAVPRACDEVISAPSPAGVGHAAACVITSVRPWWKDRAVDTDDFWELIEAARASAVAGRPFHEVLADLLAARAEQEILDYQEKFDEAHQALYRWDVWAAAYLIGGGCSDDSFMDFRAGLIAQGRGWYQKAADSPDSLAEHPAVAAAARRPWDNPLFYEKVNYAASYAFQRVSGDDHAFWDALNARDESERTPADMGEDFDFGDEQEMRRRLPRLAALCLGNNAALCRTGGSAAGQITSYHLPGNEPNRQGGCG